MKKKNQIDYCGKSFSCACIFNDGMWKQRKDGGRDQSGIHQSKTWSFL